MGDVCREAASITTDATGNYNFGGLANGSYTMTPSESGYTLTPASASVTVNRANVTAQNFSSTGAYSNRGRVRRGGVGRLGRLERRGDGHHDH